jgi:hypothetical protein
MRRTVLVLLAATLLAPNAATAKPAAVRTCPPGWADPAGDARAPERDIVCLDIAASTKDVVIVLRLAGVPGQDQAGRALGESWSVSLVFGGVRVLAKLERPPVTGADKWSLTVGDTSKPVIGIVRSDRTILWTAKRADVLRGRRLVVGTWAAQTVLATLTDDSASGQPGKR